MIDINRKGYYIVNEPKRNYRTKIRLIRMNNMGIDEVGYGEFGIKGLFSGLYIERIWYYNDDEFNDYLLWVYELQCR